MALLVHPPPNTDVTTAASCSSTSPLITLSPEGSFATAENTARVLLEGDQTMCPSLDWNMGNPMVTTATTAEALAYTAAAAREEERRVKSSAVLPEEIARELEELSKVRNCSPLTRVVS